MKSIKNQISKLIGQPTVVSLSIEIGNEITVVCGYLSKKGKTFTVKSRTKTEFSLSFGIEDINEISMKNSYNRILLN